jgi:hypothetical protein
MEPTPRLYQCMLCYRHVRICRKCDHGNIYCGPICSGTKRKISVKAARARYQNSFKGRRNHAASQARYRIRLKKVVMDHGSLFLPQNAPMTSTEKKPKKLEKGHMKSAITCCFCQNPVSDWIRNGFLRRRDYKKPARLREHPQGP